MWFKRFRKKHGLYDHRKEVSDEYLAGYSARLNDRPFNNNETDDWKMGWLNVDQALKLK